VIAYAFKAFEISYRGELRVAQALRRRIFEANGRWTGSHIGNVRAVGPVGCTESGRETKRGPSDEKGNPLRPDLITNTASRDIPCGSMVRRPA
jgi:hypothetical protein